MIVQLNAEPGLNGNVKKRGYLRSIDLCQPVIPVFFESDFPAVRIECR